MSLSVHDALNTSSHVVVEACAGSGKTWLLSSRIARALVEGAPPRSILALTFTNKAAAEMRSRVVDHLKEMASASPKELEDKLKEWGLSGDALVQARDRAPRVFAEFLRDPQPPTISTFHSWYVQLMAMAPVSLAGWATMSLSRQSWMLMRQAWQMFFTQEAAKLPYADLVSLLGSHNLRLAMEAWVRARVEWHACGEWVARSENPTALSEAIRANELDLHRFFEDHAQSMALLATAYEGVDRREAFYQALAGIQASEPASEVWSRLNGALLTELDLDVALAQSPPRRFALKWGDKKFVRAADRARWGSRAQEIEQTLQDFAQAVIRQRDLNEQRLFEARRDAVWQCSEALERCLNQVMSRGHEIDFTGLELSASRLLRGQAAAGFHARLDQRFRHILVDEFQDTNPVQWSMLKHWLSQYLQSDSMSDSAPRVFLVGDPKQSIYRFRRADPQVFQLAGDWLVKHFKAIRLQADTTRRCAQPIVDFLNQAAPRMLGQAEPARYRQHSTLSKLPGWVRRLPVACADAEASSWEVEGRQIARALMQLRADHTDLRWSDIRVLTRTRTHMADYEAALRSHGIPFVSDRSGGLLHEPEVKDLIALLRFLAYPWSDRDLAQVLKSPIGGLSDDQLVAIASASAAPSSTSAKPTLLQRLRQHAAQTDDSAVQRLATELTRWQSWADQLPVHDLLDRIIHQHHLMDRMAARFSGARGVQCLANIEALIALALELDHGRLPSLARFLQELTRWSEAPETESPGLGVLPGADAVSLSSLHSAKGLEARVVVLAGMLDREPTDKGLRWLMHWNEARDRIESAYLWQRSDPLPEGLLCALRDDQRQSQDEDFNLLYVGITRAKEFLLLSAAKGTDHGWYQQISEFCEEWMPPECNIPAASEKTLQWRGLNFPKPTQGQHHSDRLASSMPSSLHSGLRAESLAIRKGKALHRLLEFGLQRPENLSSELLAEFALPRQARSEVMTALQVIRESAVSSVIFSADVLAYAEAEWVTASGEVIRPDRVVRVRESPEEWWIVDFKWQLLDSERGAYASQLASYQDTLQAIRPLAKVLAKILTAGGQAFVLRQGQLVPDVH